MFKIIKRNPRLNECQEAKLEQKVGRVHPEFPQVVESRLQDPKEFHQRDHLQGHLVALENQEAQ